jgi:hypothetical protein
MDKYIIVSNKLRERSVSPIRIPEVIVLGIFGCKNKMPQSQISEQIINPMLEKLQRMPDRLLIPSEGDSSLYIQDWAESMNIPCSIFYPDWKKMGKRAQIMRDIKIQSECTHALIFLSNKTNRYKKISESMAKKNKKVFELLSENSKEITMSYITP